MTLKEEIIEMFYDKQFAWVGEQETDSRIILEFKRDSVTVKAIIEKDENGS